MFSTFNIPNNNSMNCCFVCIIPLSGYRIEPWPLWAKNTPFNSILSLFFRWNSNISMMLNKEAPTFLKLSAILVVWNYRCHSRQSPIARYWASPNSGHFCGLFVLISIIGYRSWPLSRESVAHARKGYIHWYARVWKYSSNYFYRGVKKALIWTLPATVTTCK